MTLEFLSGDALESELAIGGLYISPALILEMSALCAKETVIIYGILLKFEFYV